MKWPNTWQALEVEWQRKFAAIPCSRPGFDRVAAEVVIDGIKVHVYFRSGSATQVSTTPPTFAFAAIGDWLDRAAWAEWMVPLASVLSLLAACAMLISPRNRWTILAAAQVATTVLHAVLVTYAALHGREDRWGSVWMLPISGCVSLTICYRTPSRPVGICEKCGYNLTGNVSGICPECGTPIAPERPAERQPP
ncbi:MAG: hypothetical protein ACHRHE_04240 [Tepidisphaerales bacterium]